MRPRRRPPYRGHRLVPSTPPVETSATRQAKIDHAPAEAGVAGARFSSFRRQRSRGAPDQIQMRLGQRGSLKGGRPQPLYRVRALW